MKYITTIQGSWNSIPNTFYLSVADFIRAVTHFNKREVLHYSDSYWDTTNNEVIPKYSLGFREAGILYACPSYWYGSYDELNKRWMPLTYLLKPIKACLMRILVRQES